MGIGFSITQPRLRGANCRHTDAVPVVHTGSSMYPKALLSPLSPWLSSKFTCNRHPSKRC